MTELETLRRIARRATRHVTRRTNGMSLRPQDAEDMEQEAWAWLWQRSQRYQPKGDPEPSLEQRMREAQDLDTLYTAADLIGEVADPQRRAELTALFEQRQFALEAQ